MYYLAILGFITIMVFGLVGASDLDVEQQEYSFCLEMYGLYEETNGQLGWPKEVCYAN
jgi:hypothetical protein|tara:strand:- start:4231 stop:4404 length:174 start_codon:yes stop_codon:yes gene_type:complete